MTPFFSVGSISRDPKIGTPRPPARAHLLLHISQDSEGWCAAGMQPSELLHIFEDSGCSAREFVPVKTLRLKDPPQTERQSLAIQDHHMFPPKFTGFKLAKMCRLRHQGDSISPSAGRGSFAWAPSVGGACGCYSSARIACQDSSIFSVFLWSKSDMFMLRTSDVVKIRQPACFGCLLQTHSLPAALEHSLECPSL